MHHSIPSLYLKGIQKWNKILLYWHLLGAMWGEEDSSDSFCKGSAADDNTKTVSACVCAHEYECVSCMTIFYFFYLFFVICVSQRTKPSDIFIDQNNDCCWSGDRRAWQAGVEMWPTADKKAFSCDQKAGSDCYRGCKTMRLIFSFKRINKCTHQNGSSGNAR